MHHHDRPPAGVAGQAVADVPGAPLRGLARPGRIGDERTAKRDQRRLAARENAVRLRRIGDAAERHQRHAVQTMAQFLDEMHVGHRRAEPVRRVHFQRARMRPAGEADVIDIALAREQIADDAGLGRADAAGDPVIARQLQPDDEVRAARCAQRSHQFGDNPRAAFPVAAVFVLSPVGPRGQELMEHVPMAGGDLHTGEAAGLQDATPIPRSRSIRVTDFRRRQRARHRPGQIVGQARRRRSLRDCVPDSGGRARRPEFGRAGGNPGFPPPRRSRFSPSASSRRHTCTRGRPAWCRIMPSGSVTVIAAPPAARLAWYWMNRSVTRPAGVASRLIEACVIRLRSRLPANSNGVKSVLKLAVDCMTKPLSGRESRDGADLRAVAAADCFLAAPPAMTAGAIVR